MSPREQAIQAAQELLSATEDTTRLLTAIEGARMQISSTGDELRDSVRTLRDRVNGLIRELELLRKQIGRQTRPGDSV